MKKMVVLVCALGALTAYGQSTSADRLLESTGAQRGKAATGMVRVAKPNEIIQGDVVYSGIAVQLVKARNPVQLFNPAAPPEYGSSLDNLVRDPTTGHAFGLKILSIRF
jgi:hypothetical protein